MWLLVLLAALPSDSSAVLAAARAAQADFEQVRLRYLPQVRGNAGGTCDEIVGRFCFWHGDDDDHVPPPEHTRITAAREHLIARLDSLHTLSPGDEWILGQYVRYLVEARHLDRAVQSATDCNSAPWWCAALAGYALHVAQRYAAADSAFALATSLMDESLRCSWDDLSLVLDHRPRGYGRTPCAERRAIEARIWWLADPLYLTPGNERRTEHYARRVMSRLQDHARSGYDVRWGSDLNELLMRYGWPVAWERDELGRPYDPRWTRIISHNAPRPRAFLPPRQLLDHPEQIAFGTWDIHPDHPRSNYAPAYARVVETIDHAQVATFRRGAATVVVAAFRSPGDDGRPRATKDAALVFTPEPSVPPVMSRTEGPGPFRLAVTVPSRAGLVSLEALGSGDSAGAAARGRQWLSVSDGLTVSHPLLFDAPPDDSLPGSLETVFPFVRPSAGARPAERVGVYWEVTDWGPEPATARFALTVTRTGEGWLTRVARAIRLAKREQPSVSLGWDETLPGDASYYPRALAVGLPEGQPGTYLLRIEVRVGDRVAAAERSLEVSHMWR